MDAGAESVVVAGVAVGAGVASTWAAGVALALVFADFFERLARADVVDDFLLELVRFVVVG